MIPTEAKAKALLVFRCSRDWMFPSQAERMRGVTHRVDCGKVAGGRPKHRPPQQGSQRPWQSAQDLSREFLQWVQQKEKEEFVFWLKPDRSFQKLSQFFESHIDPVTRMNYQPLLLDKVWWRVKFQATKCARYVHNPAVVIADLSDHGPEAPQSQNFEFSALQELIFQSNPTLEPIALWPHAPSLRYMPTSTAARGGAGAPGGDLAGSREPPSLQENYARGFICYDMMSVGGLSGTPKRQVSTRMSDWPSKPSARLDNLQARWQLEDSVSQRQSALCLSARGQLESRPYYSIDLFNASYRRPQSEDTRRALETSLALKDLYERNQIRGMSQSTILRL